MCLVSDHRKSNLSIYCLYVIPASPNYKQMMLMTSLQDTFFYSLVYDPAQKTLLADKGEIRVGLKFQATVPDKMPTGK